MMTTPNAITPAHGKVCSGCARAAQAKHLEFKDILFPVDFSVRTEETADYVAGIATKFGSRVTVLHALEGNEGGTAEITSSAMVYQDPLREQRELALNEFATRALYGLDVNRVVVMGNAAAAIVRYAQEHETDLIVIPTHGGSAFRRLMLGSVTSDVLHGSHCPVWTTAHTKELAHFVAREMRSMVCGVDFSADPVGLIQGASKLAKSYGAILYLVHAVQAMETRSGSAVEGLMEDARQRIARYQEQAGTNWESRVYYGGVMAVLKDAAAHFRSDLMIVGRGHLRDRFGRIRTHIGAIIRESGCPVLSL